MNTQVSRSLVGRTVSVAIAAASILVTVPSFAGGSQSAPSAKPATPVSQTANPGTIVEVASANSSFKTLVAAVKAAGLMETLSSKKDSFTVFAPTDAAFAALPKGTLEKLLKPENKATLQKILTYHVVAGTVESKSVKTGQVKTVEGSPLNVKVQNSGITVEKAKVTTADVKASNGVIHVIDTVLLPPGLKL